MSTNLDLATLQGNNTFTGIQSFRNAIDVQGVRWRYKNRPNKVLQNYVAESPWLSSNTPVNNNWYGVAWSPELGLFAAVAGSGTGNRVMTSPDGINWTVRTSAADNDWRAVTWSPELGLFVAVGISGTGNRVMTSISAHSYPYRS